jgi:GST-like protein
LTKRQLDVLDRRLADHAYMAGEEYSIADMAIWPWYGALVRDEIYDNAGSFAARAPRGYNSARRVLQSPFAKEPIP